MHNLRCFLCVVHRPRRRQRRLNASPAAAQPARGSWRASPRKYCKQGQIRLSQSRVRRWSQTTHDAGSTGRVALARLWVRPVPRLPSSDGLFSPAAMRPSPLLMTRATTVLSRAAGAKSVSADQAPPLAALRCRICHRMRWASIRITVVSPSSHQYAVACRPIERGDRPASAYRPAQAGQQILLAARAVLPGLRRRHEVLPEGARAAPSSAPPELLDRPAHATGSQRMCVCVRVALRAAQTWRMDEGGCYWEVTRVKQKVDNTGKYPDETPHGKAWGIMTWNGTLLCPSCLLLPAHARAPPRSSRARALAHCGRVVLLPSLSLLAV